MEFPTIVMLEVQQADIDGAVPGDGAHCPIARAIKRQLGVLSAEALCHEDMSVTDGEGHYAEYSGPRSIDKFMDRFDNFEQTTAMSAALSRKYRVPVKPTTFRLRRVAAY